MGRRCYWKPYKRRQLDPSGARNNMTRQKPIYDEIRSLHLGKLQNYELEFSDDFEVEKDNGHRGYVLQISFENDFHEYEKFLSQFRSSEPDQNYVKWTCPDLMDTVISLW